MKKENTNFLCLSCKKTFATYILDQISRLNHVFKEQPSDGERVVYIKMSLFHFSNKTLSQNMKIINFLRFTLVSTQLLDVMCNFGHCTKCAKLMMMNTGHPLEVYCELLLTAENCCTKFLYNFSND